MANTRTENILQNYDEFATLKALQQIDLSDPVAVENSKQNIMWMMKSSLNCKQFISLLIARFRIIVLPITIFATGSAVRKKLRKKEKSTTDWMTCFEVDLLKSQEINPDYILGPIFEHNRQNKGKGEMIEEVKRLIRSSPGNRAKEGPVDFIQQTNPDDLPDKASIIDAFFTLLNTNSNVKQKH